MLEREKELRNAFDSVSQAISAIDNLTSVLINLQKTAYNEIANFLEECGEIKEELNRKDAEISKLNSDLAIVRQENQRLWDENVSIRKEMDNHNKKVIKSYEASKLAEPEPECISGTRE